MQRPELSGDDELVDILLATARLFIAVASEALIGSTPEVTLPQFRALVLVDQQGTLTVADLARALGVAPSTVTRMCDRLVAKQLIRREAGTSDRRQVSLRLEPMGRDLIALSTQRRRERLEQILAAVPTSSRATLLDAMNLLLEAGDTWPRSGQLATGPAER
jgi:DNA-binding MarR family transcriptional regulator